MHMNKEITTDFTKGNIFKQLIVSSIPFMLSNSFQILYSVIDMIVVGRTIGGYGLSAISLASQVSVFMTMLCLGLTTGGQVLIAQMIGSKRISRINAIIGTLTSIVTVLSFALTVVGILFRGVILRLLDTPIECYQMADCYLFITCIGTVFSFGYNLFSAVLRGIGDFKHPVYFIIAASVTNLLLDCLFVLVLHWGVAGAAIATVIGQAVAFFWSLIFLYKNRAIFHFDFKMNSFRINPQEFQSIIKLGIPFSLQNCAINISMLFVYQLINGVGVYESAVFGIGIKIDDIISKLTQGINYAVSSMVAQNIGAGENQRVRKTVYTAWVVGGIIYLFFAAIYLNCGTFLFALFTNDTEVIKLCNVFIHAIVFSYPAMAIMRGTNGFAQGIGAAKLSMLCSFLDGFVLRIALSLLLGEVLKLGLFGYFLGFGLAAYGSIIPIVVYFFSGKWEAYFHSIIR